MKPLLLFLVIAVLTPFSVAQRLPHIAEPVSYKLNFAPDFSNNTFAGMETIEVRVLQNTSEIVLNAAGIDFHSAIVRTSGGGQQARVTLDKENQMAPGGRQAAYAGSGDDRDSLHRNTE